MYRDMIYYIRLSYYLAYIRSMKSPLLGTSSICNRLASKFLHPLIQERIASKNNSKLKVYISPSSPREGIQKVELLHSLLLTSKHEKLKGIFARHSQKSTLNAANIYFVISGVKFRSGARESLASTICGKTCTQIYVLYCINL